MDKLNNIRIVFLDVDGTLTNSDRKITNNTKKAIKRVIDKGILVVITSGRNLPYCISTSRKALASKLVIASNGAQICDYGDNKYIYSNSIPQDKIKMIWNYCQDNQIGLILNTISKTYSNSYLVKSLKKNYQIINDYNYIEEELITQAIIFTINKDKALKSKEIIEDLELDIPYFSNSYFDKESLTNIYNIDIINKGVSKGSAIKLLLNNLRIKKEESICFGDYTNDLDMFNVCGYKVSMGNATSDIKEEAFMYRARPSDALANRK